MDSQTLRERLEFSRPEWSRILGVSTGTVYRWENGEHPPTGLSAVVLHGIGMAVAQVGPAKVRDRLFHGVSHLIYEGLKGYANDRA